MKIIQFVKRQKLITKLIFLGIFLFFIIIIAPALVSCIKTGESCSASVESAVFGEKEEEEEINNDATSRVEIINVAEFQKNNFTVSTTGSVESTEQVEIRSQVLGKVKGINVNLGDNIGPGQLLVSFENADIAAQLLQAEAGLEAEKARLEEVKRGARPEDIQIIESQVANAEISIQEAQKNLENAKKKARLDIESIYSSALSSLRSAADAGKGSILFITEIQYVYFQDGSQKSLEIATAKGRVVEVFLGKKNADMWAAVTIDKLDGGAFGAVQDIPGHQSFDEINAALFVMRLSLERIKETLEAIPVSGTLNGFEATNLSLEKNNINGQISAIAGIQQGIPVQKAGSDILLNSAQMGLTGAKAALENAQNQLDSIKAGATIEQIIIQESRVKTAKAAVNQVQAQLIKTIIRSPISGVVAVLPLRLGELISPGQLVASVVNTKGLEIKAYIDSNNLFSISPGNTAIIEGDIEGVVTHIAPSVDPVTKKIEVRISVISENQSNLVVGEFVNLNISVNEESIADDVYIIPLKAVKVISGKTIVYIVNNNQVVEKKEVVSGKIVGESIEILDGINADMNIVYSVRGLEPGQSVEIK